MGVNSWGESPLYMNPVPSFYDGNESTSRSKGLRLAMASQEGIIVWWCPEGSRSAKLWADLSACNA